MIRPMIYRFYQKEWRLENVASLYAICTIKNKNKYVEHIRTLKQALNHELIPKKEHKIIHQKASKSFIDRNNKLRKNAKNGFVNNFSKLTKENYVKCTKVQRY